MEKLMQCSDQCYGEIGPRPPTMVGGPFLGLQLGAYTEASSVSQGTGKTKAMIRKGGNCFPKRSCSNKEMMIRFQSHQIVI
jgi:hypothetical protein